MKIRFSDKDIEILQRLLEKIETGDCCSHKLVDENSGLVFIAQDRQEQLDESRLIKLILTVLKEVKNGKL